MSDVTLNDLIHSVTTAASGDLLSNRMQPLKVSFTKSILAKKSNDPAINRDYQIERGMLALIGVMGLRNIGGIPPELGVVCGEVLKQIDAPVPADQRVKVISAIGGHVGEYVNRAVSVATKVSKSIDPSLIPVSRSPMGI